MGLGDHGVGVGDLDADVVDGAGLTLVLDDDQLQRWVGDDEVREIEYGKQSLMPSDYDKTLTSTELRDLLAFLSRQGRRSDGDSAGRRRR